MKGRGNGFIDARERQCNGKTQFASKAAAKLFLKRARNFERRADVKAYQCPWCKAWHVGHKAGRNKPAEAR